MSKRSGLESIAEEEIEIPIAEMIQRRIPAVNQPAPQLVTDSLQIQAQKGRELAKDSSAYTGTIMSKFGLEEAVESTFTTSEHRVKTSLSLPESINQQLDDRVHDLKKKGHKKVSREWIVEQALRSFLVD